MSTEATATVRLLPSGREEALPDAPFCRLDDGPVANLVINRAGKRNALNRDIWQAIAPQMRAVAGDPAIRAVLLRGAGEAAFSGGADIAEFPTLLGSEEARGTYADLVRDAQIAVQLCPKPVVALIRGACVGGGCGLALACDLRIAAEDARLGITPAKLGLAYSREDTARLVAAVGPARAKDILFSGRLLDSREAAACGLVDFCLPDHEVEAFAARYLAMLVANSAGSIRIAKAVVNAVSGLDPSPARDLDAQIRACFASADFAEGWRAFLERRQPRFGQ